MPPDYYDRLGLSPTATQDEIRRAYRRLARKTHPDRNPEADAEARFQEVKEAYEVLSDAERRARYDRRRRQGAAPDPGAVTAASVAETGCVSYYLPRVGVGLLATVAFFVVDAFNVWQMDDPRLLWTAVLAVSAVVGLLSVGILRLAPEAPADYAVRASPSDLRVWNEQRMVLRLDWSRVDRVTFDAETGVLELAVVRAAGTPSIEASPPVLPTVERTDSRIHLRVDLSGTDVSVPALRRVLQAVRRA